MKRLVHRENIGNQRHRKTKHEDGPHAYFPAEVLYNNSFHKNKKFIGFNPWFQRLL